MHSYNHTLLLQDTAEQGVFVQRAKGTASKGRIADESADKRVLGWLWLTGHLQDFCQKVYLPNVSGLKAHISVQHTVSGSKKRT